MRTSWSHDLVITYAIRNFIYCIGLQVDGHILPHPQLSYQKPFDPGNGGSWNLKDVRSSNAQSHARSLWSLVRVELKLSTHIR